MPEFGEDGYWKEEEKDTPNDKSLNDSEYEANKAYQEAAARNVKTIESYVKAYVNVQHILKKPSLSIDDVDALLRFFKQDRSLEQLKRPKDMKEDDYVVNLVQPCINAIGEGYPDEEQLKNCFDIGQPATEDTSTTYTTYLQIEAPLETSQTKPQGISIYQKIWDKLNSDKVKDLWNAPLLTSDVSQKDKNKVQRCRQFFDIINGNSPSLLESRDFDLVKLLNDRLEPENPFKYSRGRNPPSIYKGLDDFNRSRSRYLVAFEETEAHLKDLILKFAPILTATREKKKNKINLKIPLVVFTQVS
ncbi:MAG: hypothetical protein VX737_02490 [Pseudomonadota bacterium]|nr:hypothetical protein [Pseudomonadota bacterium]